MEELITNLYKFYNQISIGTKFGIDIGLTVGIFGTCYFMKKKQNKNQRNLSDFYFYLNEFKKNNSFDNAINLYKANQKFYLGKLNNKQVGKLELIFKINREIWPEIKSLKEITKYF